MEIVDPTGRLMRWRLRLAEYTFEIHHKKGYLNTQADAVSRLPSDGHTAEHEDYCIPCFVAARNQEPTPTQIGIPELLREQEQDSFCQNIRFALERGRGCTL